MDCMTGESDSVVVIGAGVGGLAAAIRLAAAGRDVTLCEAHAHPGGKLRALPSAAGPVDAGPTVLTMRAVFDELFALAGGSLDATLHPVALPRLARHFWQDGTRLDLFPDTEASVDAIGAAIGARAAAEFRRFDAEMALLYAAFDGPMMQAARPRIGAAARATLRAPALWPLLAPGRTLAGLLRARFTDPRLRQLFGRYSTYVGGIPQRTPAVLGLIWRAEAAGVWTLPGGLHQLARALADLFQSLGGTLRLSTPVARITAQGGAVTGVALAEGAHLPAAQVVFAGDPGALRAGLLGADLRRLLPRAASAPRSLSARVWSFAARAEGLPLDHHSLLFAATEADEFGPLARGATPAAPTVYICAQDRVTGATNGPERFQFILNAPASGRDPHTPDQEARECLTQTFDRLARFGLRFDPLPDPQKALTLPQGFAALFPGSRGAIYGRSPHGALAPFLRPGARTRLTGLYLAGGGAHPGAGLPMAALSGRNAAQAVQADRASTRMSHPTATPGGISMPSATTDAARSR